MDKTNETTHEYLRRKRQLKFHIVSGFQRNPTRRDDSRLNKQETNNKTDEILFQNKIEIFAPMLKDNYNSW